MGEPQPPEAFIYIGRSDSSCSACYGPANLNETSHISGGVIYDRKTNTTTVRKGCGVAWVRRVPMYMVAELPGDPRSNDMFNWDDMSKPFFKDQVLPFKLEGTGEWADDK